MPIHKSRYEPGCRRDTAVGGFPRLRGEQDVIVRLELPESPSAFLTGDRARVRTCSASIRPLWQDSHAPAPGGYCKARRRSSRVRSMPPHTWEHRSKIESSAME